VDGVRAFRNYVGSVTRTTASGLLGLDLFTPAFVTRMLRFLVFSMEDGFGSL